jgi:type IV pilus assembly protein PilN
VIKINLLAGERKAAKKKVVFDAAQQLTAICALIMLLGGAAVGWRYWVVQTESVRLDTELAAAQQETTRLHSVIAQVQQFEQRKAQLQQRVTLIEQLRKEQTGPVHMLDQISGSLPPTLWLTEMKQTGTPNEVLIDGKSLSLTGLSDFVANLEQSGYFQRSIEIVSSATDTSPTSQGEVIKFQIKAVFKNPNDTAAVVEAKPADGSVKAKS